VSRAKFYGTRIQVSGLLLMRVPVPVTLPCTNICWHLYVPDSALGAGTASRRSLTGPDLREVIFQDTQTSAKLDVAGRQVGASH
jgi:hypothetical protein